jgi:hypothetical protein
MNSLSGARRSGQKKRQAKSTGAGGSYSGLGEETAARGIRGKCRRVCGWRAKHAGSSGHLDLRPSWLGLEPGGSCSFPSARFRDILVLCQSQTGISQKRNVALLPKAVASLRSLYAWTTH